MRLEVIVRIKKRGLMGESNLLEGLEREWSRDEVDWTWQLSLSASAAFNLLIKKENMAQARA